MPKLDLKPVMPQGEIYKHNLKNVTISSQSSFPSENTLVQGNNQNNNNMGSFINESIPKGKKEEDKSIENVLDQNISLLGDRQ